MKRSIAAVLATVLATFAGSNVQAQTLVPTPPLHSEPCAVTLLMWPERPATAEGQSSGLAFEFRAPSALTVDGVTVVADTSSGWYTWAVATVAVDAEQRGYFLSWPRVATFQKSVVVRHAWVTKAGKTACDIPQFAQPAMKLETPLATRGWPRVVARSIGPPYDTNCATPFAPAKVVHVVNPQYPQDLVPGHFTADVFVRIGDHDDLVDAWVYKPSVSDEINARSLEAARAARYQSAVSYCQKTVGDYLFKTLFAP